MLAEPTDSVVSVHGQRVGRLTRLNDDEDFRFRFLPEYADAAPRRILGQQFVDRFPGGLASSGLPGWFANLLPQGPSRRLMEGWLGLPHDEDDFDLLRGLGDDLPGAVSLQPAQRGDGEPLALAPAPAATAGPTSFSLAGAQRKLLIREGERGLVLPAAGEQGSYIAKFRDPEYGDLPRLEHATTRWAREAGIDTHQTQLVPSSSISGMPEPLASEAGEALLATRFDRRTDAPGQEPARVHCEDFCQVLGLAPGNDQFRPVLRQIGNVVAHLCPWSFEELVRRTVFNIVCGNGDAHAKNFALIYDDTDRASLSPAYDLLATVVVPDVQRRLCLWPEADAAFEGWTREKLVGVFRGLLLTDAELDRTVGDAVDRARRAWVDAADGFGLPEEHREEIDRHLAGLRL